MTQTLWLNTKQLDAIRRRLDYVDGLNASASSPRLAERDKDFAEAKKVIDRAARGDQIFIVSA